MYSIDYEWVDVYSSRGWTKGRRFYIADSDGNQVGNRQGMIVGNTFVVDWTSFEFTNGVSAAVTDITDINDAYSEMDKLMTDFEVVSMDDLELNEYDV